MYKFICLLFFILLTIGSAQAKEWNIMLFINGDNNLSSYADKDIAEMVKAGKSSDYFDITIMLDQSKSKDSKYIHLGTNGAKDTVIQKGEIDSGDYREVNKFVTWSSQNYPANNYMLVIWNHGSGWLKSLGIQKGVSYDDQSGNHISTPQLSLMLEKMPVHISILGFDACLMQMMEVVYEVRNYVNYVIASEETEPGDGWAYDLWFNNRDGFNAEELIKNVVNGFITTGQNITLSGISMAKYKEFLVEFDTWTKTLTLAQYKALRDKSTSYAIKDNRDLGQMLNRNKFAKAYNLYSDMFIINKANGSVGKSTGIAIYAPTTTFDVSYEELSFAKDFPAWVNLIRKP